MSTGPEVQANLAAVVRKLARSEKLLLALDFDGTLAPIVAKAADARALPESSAALERLAQLADTHIALVSGRALESLRAVAAPSAQTLLIGSHGAERHWPALARDHALATDQEPDRGPDQEPDARLLPQQEVALRAVLNLLEDMAAGAAGLWVERKPAGAVLHTREAEDERAREAESEASRVLEGLDGVHVMRGKRVVEASVIDASKGAALAELLARLNEPALLYAGDDVTDETVFARLAARAQPSLFIKVGSGQTRAGHRVADPQELAQVLNSLLRERAQYLENGR